MAGGIPALKEWIVNLDKDMVQVPFPDGFRCPDTSFEVFLKSLAEQGVTPDHGGRRDDRDLPGRQRQLRPAGVHPEAPRAGATSTRRC